MLCKILLFSLYALKTKPMNQHFTTTTDDAIVILMNSLSVAFGNPTVYFYTIGLVPPNIKNRQLLCVLEHECFVEIAVSILAYATKSIAGCGPA
jgi:hypothetical protein